MMSRCLPKYLKKQEKTETLIEIIKIYCQDIIMKFGIWNCAMMIKKKGRRENTEGIELLNQQSVRSLFEKENWIYLGMVEGNNIVQTKIK